MLPIPYLLQYATPVGSSDPNFASGYGILAVTCLTTTYRSTAITNPFKELLAKSGKQQSSRGRDLVARDVLF